MDGGRRQWLAMAMAATGAACWPARASQQVVVALGARHSLYHLPVLLAERLGFFRQQGLRVTRLARGVPAGSELEYVDLGTIAHALVDRR